MKRLIILILSFTLLFLNIVSSTTYAKDNPPEVSADSVVLMDSKTGEILYEKNPDTAYPPASTTKLMTALLTLEKTNLDDTVTVGKNPPFVDGSKIYLFEGENIKIRDLLYGLILASGNDCAEALAEYISGSMDNFAVEMNKRALELGAKNTNFVNPSGLYDANHNSSAKDLALIMRELSKNPEYTTIATTSSYKIPPTNKSAAERPLWNENKLIQKTSSLYYSGCLGGKTGYTVQSSHSYVATATRNNQQLIVALVHDKNKTFFPDSIKLFDYGFNNFQLTRLFSKGDLVTTYNNNDLKIPLLAASDFYYVKEKNNAATPSYSLDSQNLSKEFFKSGDIVANANVSINNKNIGSLKLMSGSDHELKQIIQSTAFQSNYLRPEYLVPIGLVVLGLLALLIKKLRTDDNIC
ncbi:D-alanyl-D-alanine carboxypeptidase family protein [Clostridium sp. DJ247]|uniref:D-alanyl-D-alanine carboxypeptidase family protein n=1 Tax=Clostridium sp. DJ247 TaxID=2726188 RepID=UPI0016279C0F|nr:D-alanyl-D-alanine carboxypeptidase family protein [Clostridium sp. DJ247]MBC2579273.1 D-alanyl-D-alanine carboxypeptidase [Clostridium sp. DJ247]MBC2579276.1 D-alanyl-D-alanine carboxypeptidase [Clostridium sp. DJ247]